MESDDTSFLACDELLQSLVSKHQPEPPHLLYHYTNAAGLKGIVQSGALWASHFEYTNDAEEVNYGIKLARERLGTREQQENLFHTRQHFDDVLAGERNDVPVRNALTVLATATLRKMEYENHSGKEFFFLCFSEHGDMLSQWRAYAGDGSGFAIGFDPGDVVCAQNKKQLRDGDTLDCFKVIYEPHEQTAIVDKIIDQVLDRFASRVAAIEAERRPEFLTASNTYLMSSILRVAMIFKHPGFHEEAEWRVIHTKMQTEDGFLNADGFPTKTRTSGTAITPYVEIPLHSSNECAIRKVIMGPKTAPGNQRIQPDIALKTLLAPSVEISRSSIPYR